MALTKETIVDKIEVLEMGQVQVRTATKIIEDSVVISKSFFRNTLEPRRKNGDTWGDTDISGQDARVQAICNATWTSTVKTDWETMVDAQE